MKQIPLALLVGTLIASGCANSQSTAPAPAAATTTPTSAKNLSLHDKILAAIKAATPKDTAPTQQVIDHAVGPPIPRAPTSQLLPLSNVPWPATASQRWTLIVPGPTQFSTSVPIAGYPTLEICRKAASQVFDTSTGAPISMPAFCVRAPDAEAAGTVGDAKPSTSAAAPKTPTGASTSWSN